jgi:dehypoxanthine futalosine cyclase
MLLHAGVAELMAAANDDRARRHGDRAYVVHSLNLNPTNVCENKCDLCAFWRERGDDDAYVLGIEGARDKLRAAASSGLAELHIVGGVSPEIDLAYYEELLRAAKTILPSVFIQGMTAVEISYLARASGLSVADVLTRLKDAGLGSVSGGGAEIFDPSVRDRLCSRKISAAEWLDVHREAHRLGIFSNATMLYGHIEKPEHIVDHLERIRSLQDETGGVLAFIPLPFLPQGTGLGVPSGPGGAAVARVVAFSRLYLDNVPHVRVLANYYHRNLLEVLAGCGVDDFGGTSFEERIAAAAGAPDHHRFRSVEDITSFFARLGREPVWVNSVYASVPDGPEPAAVGLPAGIDGLLEKAGACERVSDAEAVRLHDEAPFQLLGRAADRVRRTKVPADVATFVIDRNISVTNVCEAGCRFCAFHVKPGDPGAFALSRDEVADIVRESADAGATQVMVQGGLNPDLPLSFYEDLLSAMRSAADVWLHSLSPAEIVYLAGREGIGVRETLERLRAAGLDSLPGGGAEILVEEVRRRVSPAKVTADEWFDVMRTAHGLGMKSTATMVYGLGETTAQRVEHLIRVRELQDETGGFTAFIPWSFQSANTRLDLPRQTGPDYLRMVALGRIVLDNIPHVQAGWVTEGADLAQLALLFGADDFGGVLMDEQVVRATGLSNTMTPGQAASCISAAGFVPVQRTTQYEKIREWPG